MAANLPIVRELLPPPDAGTAFQRLSALPHCVFFDSARKDARLGRYSFLAADPFDYLEVPADGSDGLNLLKARIAPFVSTRQADLPPFQGGAAGLFGYDLARSLEHLPSPAIDEFQLPAMAIGMYDVVLAFDHESNRAWIISQGFPETNVARRQALAQQRLEWFADRLTMSPHESVSHQEGGRCPISRLVLPQDRQRPDGGMPPETAGRSASVAIRTEQHPMAALPGLTSNFSHGAYLAAVERAIEYIYAGDVFQVNLAQRLLYPAAGTSVQLYQRLRERNPATFGGYFDLGAFQICSASPERFVSVLHGEVETRPIKGTRSRTLGPEANLFAGDELQASIKDRAENVMIVDLLRNDLSRVCAAESIRVTQLCRLEQYEFVQHLVSAVRGTLRPGLNALDLLRAVFPGGSITGAPKIRAQEVIAELEPVARGAYCGSLGYLGFDGTLDTSILIRTITAGGGWWQFPVGGGIVSQSVPQREYEETWQKAEGLLRALR